MRCLRPPTPPPAIYHLEEGYKRTREGSNVAQMVVRTPRGIRSPLYRPKILPYSTNRRRTKVRQVSGVQNVRQTEFLIMPWHQIVKCEPPRWLFGYMPRSNLPEVCPPEGHQSHVSILIPHAPRSLSPATSSIIPNRALYTVQIRD